MVANRPFRFSVQASTAPDRKAWAELARKAEDLGYSTLFMPDHFGDQLAPVPALMAAADATTSLRIGALVLDNDYKHPVVLAKELATLDVLSDGRLEVGIGAGWMRSDYEQSGIPYDAPGVRVDRFEEGIAILKGAFRDGPFSFEGKHYTITGYDGTPKPVQQPYPPILIGGGAKRVLGIAGREADIVGVNFDLRGGQIDGTLGVNGTAESTRQKLDWVRAGAGDRFEDIELHVNIFMAQVTNDKDATVAAIAAGFSLTPEQAVDVPYGLVGTIDDMIETLRERRELFGFSYLTFPAPQAEELAPVVAALAGT
jgi:probable F420-dependent oxidoreductase